MAMALATAMAIEMATEIAIVTSVAVVETTVHATCMFDEDFVEN